MHTLLSSISTKYEAAVHSTTLYMKHTTSACYINERIHSLRMRVRTYLPLIPDKIDRKQCVIL